MERVKNQQLYEEALIQARDHVLEVLENSRELKEGFFPAPAAEGGIYRKHPNDECWTEGFYSGILSLAHEAKPSPMLRQLIEKHVDSFEERLKHKWVLDHHDIGFLYSLSCVAAYKTLGLKKAKETALEAARWLIHRYTPEGKFIQAWGPMKAPESYRLIIDAYMNIPLLFWAHEQTGEKEFYEVASNHAYTALQVVLREDYGTHHTYYFDTKTHKPLRGETAQGYRDDSSWARGQAWGIYGFMLAYAYTKDPVFVDVFVKVTDYFIEHLPADYIPYWDLAFSDGAQEPRDSSSAAIAICGILEGAKQLPSLAQTERYLEIAHKMMESLVNNYTPKSIQESEGLLLHGVYSIPHNQGVDESNIWGDYFYMEALVRLTQNWNPYW